MFSGLPLGVLESAACAETPVAAPAGTPFNYDDWLSKLGEGLPCESPAPSPKPRSPGSRAKAKLRRPWATTA